MSAFREPSFKERQEAAAKAKQAALDKLRARQKPAEPAAVQQQAAPVPRAKKRTAAKDTSATEKAGKQAAGKAAAPKSAGKARKK
jgi:hypothetical protein